MTLLEILLVWFFTSVALIALVYIVLEVQKGKNMKISAPAEDEDPTPYLPAVPSPMPLQPMGQMPLAMPFSPACNLVPGMHSVQPRILIFRMRRQLERMKITTESLREATTQIRAMADHGRAMFELQHLPFNVALEHEQARLDGELGILQTRGEIELQMLVKAGKVAELQAQIAEAQAKIAQFNADRRRHDTAEERERERQQRQQDAWSDFQREAGALAEPIDEHEQQRQEPPIEYLDIPPTRPPEREIVSVPVRRRGSNGCGSNGNGAKGRAASRQIRYQRPQASQ